MARPSEVVSYGICRVVFLESEEDETEFLYVPGIKWMWDQPIALGEGDLFLQFIQNLDCCWIEGELFKRNSKLLDDLWEMWRRSKGEVPAEELAEALSRTNARVEQLLKALTGVLEEQGEDIELEAELAEMRAAMKIDST